MFYIFLLPVIQHATEKLSRHPSTIRTSKVILSISMSQFRRIYRDSFVVIHTSTSSTIHIVWASSGFWASPGFWASSFPSLQTLSPNISSILQIPLQHVMSSSQ